MLFPELDPPALIQQDFAFVRCACPTCLALDRRFPGQGYQLGFWPYKPDTTGRRLCAAQYERAA